MKEIDNPYFPLEPGTTWVYEGETSRVREGLAQGYNFSRGRLKPVKYMEVVVRGAGSVFSSVEDMCRYGRWPGWAREPAPPSPPGRGGGSKGSQDHREAPVTRRRVA